MFETIEILNVGSFQDGGLKRNNPVRLALWESRLLWPSLKRPDFVLSLGTGTDLNSRLDAPPFRHILRDGFVCRAYRWLKGAIDGEDEWQNLINDIDRKYRDSFMRVNISLSSSGLALDDLDQMESLSREVLMQFQTKHDSVKVSLNLLFSRLFFELDELPAFTGHGLYHCRGTIRCRLPGFKFLQATKAMSVEKLVITMDEETLALSNLQEEVCGLCHCYSRKLEFYVRHLDQVVTMSVCNEADGRERRELSAFPQSMEWFVEQQGLRDVFGSIDHGVPNRQPCKACGPNAKKTKKRLSYASASQRPKRMKLLPVRLGL